MVDYMFSNKSKVGLRRANKNGDQTFCWCADCCGQGARGSVVQFGLFVTEDEKGSCLSCGGKGRHWVNSQDLIVSHSCPNNMKVNLASHENPLRTHRPIDPVLEASIPSAITVWFQRAVSVSTIWLKHRWAMMPKPRWLQHEAISKI
jgi:excinuclease UvrABC ATPase subunit